MGISTTGQLGGVVHDRLHLWCAAKLHSCTAPRPVEVSLSPPVLLFCSSCFVLLCPSFSLSSGLWLICASTPAPHHDSHVMTQRGWAVACPTKCGWWLLWLVPHSALIPILYLRHFERRPAPSSVFPASLMLTDAFSCDMLFHRPPHNLLLTHHTANPPLFSDVGPVPDSVVFCRLLVCPGLLASISPPTIGPITSAAAPPFAASLLKFFFFSLRQAQLRRRNFPSGPSFSCTSSSSPTSSLSSSPSSLQFL